jgi:hypothetical protein
MVKVACSDCLSFRNIEPQRQRCRLPITKSAKQNNHLRRGSVAFKQLQGGRPNARQFEQTLVASLSEIHPTFSTRFGEAALAGISARGNCMPEFEPEGRDDDATAYR